VSILTAVLGLAILLFILWDGFETMVLPRRVTRKIRLARVFYRSSWKLWAALGRRMPPGKRRETYLSVYGPLSLFLLFALWVGGLLYSFALFYCAFDLVDLRTGLYTSGSSFFTLGTVTPRTGISRFITVAEAGLGMAFLALVIAYLPIMYQAFSRREVIISLLDARGGSPSAAGELLRRHGHGDGMDLLAGLLRDWERWSAELLESHISYPVLCYFRSQHDNQSWLAAIVTMLDTSALAIHTATGPAAWQAQLTFAMARHSIVDLAQILRTPPQPPPVDRLPAADFDQLTASLAKAGIDLRRDPRLRDKLAELRAMYEPFVNSLGNYLLLRLPPWLHSGRIDNWRTSAWGRISSHSAVLPLADLGDDEHR
jgi:hypothetical protein